MFTKTQPLGATSIAKNALTLLLAVVLSCAFAFASAPGNAAYATSVEEAQQEVADAENEVASSASAYNAAVAKQERLATRISRLNKKIAKLQKQLPIQQAKCNASVVSLYRDHTTDALTMMNALLNAGSITEAITLIDNYNFIINYDLAIVEKTAKLKKQLESSRKGVKTAKAQADDTAQEAADQLAAAKAARQAAQEKAEAAQAAEEKAAAAAAKKSSSSSSSSSSSKTTVKSFSKKKTSAASASNVDWSSDKQAFVNKWAPRIDSYLSGSPTAGTGEYYAAAAWDYGVDPRWAPAISLVESSKGAACFASYNAWGFGGSGFSSWKDGIYTVVAALGGDLYGGYLTQAAAQTYCPPSWQSWYSKCATEMAKI